MNHARLQTLPQGGRRHQGVSPTYSHYEPLLTITNHIRTILDHRFIPKTSICSRHILYLLLTNDQRHQRPPVSRSLSWRTHLCPFHDVQRVHTNAWSLVPAANSREPFRTTGFHDGLCMIVKYACCMVIIWLSYGYYMVIM